jgi:hypothetical protein
LAYRGASSTGDAANPAKSLKSPKSRPKSSGSGSAAGEPEGVAGPLDEQEEEREEKLLDSSEGVREREWKENWGEGEPVENSSEGVREGGDIERSVEVSDDAGLAPRWAEFAFDGDARFELLGVRRGGPAIFLRRGVADAGAGTSVAGCADGLGERKGCARALDAETVLREVVARTGWGVNLAPRTSEGRGAVGGMTVVAMRKGGDSTERVSCTWNALNEVRSSSIVMSARLGGTTAAFRVQVVAGNENSWVWRIAEAKLKLFLNMTG